MKKKFRVALCLLLVLSSVSLLAACNAQDDVECYECGKVFELNSEEEGLKSYICENCSFEQGFIKGYNALVDELKPATTGIDDGECISIDAILYVLYEMYDNDTAEKIIDQMIEADGGSVRVFDFDYIDEVPEDWDK
ncbi:hypothetical protein AALA22_14230 [Anaerovoracaceae bacterium 41-7]